VPEVTGLREVSSREVIVELDGHAWRSFPALVVARTGISVGTRLERSDLRLIRRELKRQQALEAATRMLARRPLSRALLEERLDRRGVAPDAREEAIEALERARYLDDRSYALARARALTESGWGDAVIRFRLGSEGVGDELIEEAVDTLPPEVERAGSLASKEDKRERLLAKLKRRGFSFETIELVAGRNEDASD